MDTKQIRQRWDFLECPNCNHSVDFFDQALHCSNCESEYSVVNGIPRMVFDVSQDILLSIEKWDENYKRQLADGTFYKYHDEYMRLHFQDICDQLEAAIPTKKDSLYLEIGCGPFFLGQAMASKYDMVIGIDFCPSALEIARKMLIEKGITNYMLIQGNILKMPIKSDLLDVVYGGGVIEHFKNTQDCVNELYRVLKNEGGTFNTVPYLSLGSLSYRQIWGNIPNFPVLKGLAEWFHIKVLKGKHMRFGYELSFLGSTLQKIHKKAGFREISVKKFHAYLSFDFLPKFLKKPSVWLANNCQLFWPIVFVVGKK